MTVQDLMTRDPVWVRPETPLKQVAQLMLERSISGIPVCDARGAVLGVVSETDVVAREEGVLARPRGALSWLLARDDADPACEATTAREAMTSPAVTVHPGCTVAQAARLMHAHRVNRLPVVVDGRLVGIVSRADMVRAFVRSDGEIEREILAEVLVGTLWISPDVIDVEVTDGRVSIRGTVETRTQAELVAAYVRRVPGVLEVDASALGWLEDDLARRRAIPRQPASG